MSITFPFVGARFDTNNPQNGIYNTTAGIYTANEIMVDDVGPQPTSSDSFSTLGIVEIKGGMLKQLNALDCASGKEIQIRTDGFFIPPDEVVDSEGFVLSADWQEASTPPPLEGYVDGKYWETAGSGNPNPEQASTPFGSITAAISYMNANPIGADIAGTYALVKMDQQSSTLYNPEITVDTTPSGSRTFSLVTQQVDCTATPPDEGATCPVSAPVEEAWPEILDEFVLALQDGAFIGNAFDLQVPTEFTMERSQINFCFGSGQFGQMRAIQNGGTMLVETDGANGVIKAGTVVRVFDSDGRVIEYTDPNGAQAHIAR